MPADPAADLAALGQFFAAETGHFVDIGAGREGAVACSGQDHRLDVVVRLVIAERIVELGHQRETQCVELLRAIQGDDRGAIEALGQNVFIGHHFLSFPRDPAGSNILEIEIASSPRSSQ